MTPQEILKLTRQHIHEYASDDPDKWFYANRFVFARLQLDERKTKTEIKRHLLASNPHCLLCGEPFESGVGVHLHRLDGTCGYNRDNCTLMHPKCHQRYHAEHPETRNRGGRPKTVIHPMAESVLVKKSKMYENTSFLYWWDITPNLAKILGQYDAVEFVKKDSGEGCIVPIAALKGFLEPQRQTSRGDGNWGIKVLKDHPDKLAFEPGKSDDKWLFLPVVWVNDEKGI